MKFEIFDKHGGGILEVHQLSCVPFEHLNDMVKYSGFKFKVDGKSVPASGVKRAVYESLGITTEDVKVTKTKKKTTKRDKSKDKIPQVSSLFD